MRDLIIYGLVVAALLTACEDPVPAGRILVKNTSQDRDYNIVSVSGGGAVYSLKPGDAKLLPAGTRSISFSRRYKDFTRYYRVECPAKLESGITIKLIDVHMNRISGGCKTVSAGKQ